MIADVSLTPAERAQRDDAFIPALTGVRAYAAFMVLLYHLNFPAGFLPVAQRGYLGVDLFFILSGFIISHVYIRHMAALRWNTVRVFLWHRFVRLFPVHAVVLLGLVALITALHALGIDLRSGNWVYADLPWQLLLLHAWGTTETATWNMPSWSISAEWFAYLLFPVVALAALRLPRMLALPAAIVSLLIAVLLYDAFGWVVRDAWVGWPALLRVESEFICGAMLYRAQLFDGRALVPAWMSDALCVLAVAGFVYFTETGRSDFVLIGCLAVLILGASGSGPIARAVFGLPPIVWLGTISYSIYMVHFPVLLVLRRALDASGWQAWSPPLQTVANLTAILVVLTVAAALFYFVENPARRRLRNVMGRIEGPERALDGSLRVSAAMARGETK
jgi:peptidoglycan/LPS O-acetylase OafA/YrhL